MSHKKFVFHDRVVSMCYDNMLVPLAPTTPLGIDNICSASGPETSNHT